MDWDVLVGNARRYVDILRSCSQEEVKNWKETDLKRGFQWAEYFQKVHQKVKGKEALATQLDARLRKVGRDVGMRFGGQELSTSFLADSSLHYCKVLLENPVLPTELRTLVLAKNPAVLQRHLIEFTADQELAHTLLAMHEKLPMDPFSNALLHTNALLILDHVIWLSSAPPNSGGEETLHRLLSEVVSKLDNGLFLLCQTLVPSSPATPSSSSSSSSDPHCSLAREAIARWLLTKHSQEALWTQCPPKLLAKASSTFIFFKAYVKHLITEGDRLQNVAVLMSSGKEDGREGEMEKVKTGFVELVSSGDARVRDVTLSLLKEKSATTTAGGDSSTIIISEESAGLLDRWSWWKMVLKSAIECINDDKIT